MNNDSDVSEVFETQGTPAFKRKRVAVSFGKAAAQYNTHAALQRQVADRLLTYLPDSVPNDASVLDLGCGTGYCGALLRRKFPGINLLGLDLSMGMLKQSASSGVYDQQVCGDAEALPVADQSIALLTSSLTMQWLSNPELLFAGLARIMKPQATAVLSTFGPASLRELRMAWSKVDDYTHVNEFEPLENLRQLARAAGLDCHIRVEIIPEHFASLYALSRSLKGIGAHNMNRGQAPGLTSPARFRQAAEYFAAGHEQQIPVTWEIYYLVLQVSQ